MLESPMIQTRGFKNRAPGDGFEIRLRLPAYRSLWCSLLNGATITVDGERFAPETMRWRIGDQDYSLGEMQASRTARWPIELPAILIVPRSEPLAAGVHTVSAELQHRISYMPEELDPTTWSEERKLVIVQ